MPVKIGPHTWSSQRAAAKALGVSVPTLIRYLDLGREEALLSPLVREGKPALGYPSISAAARALGVTRATIIRRLEDE